MVFTRHPAPGTPSLMGKLRTFWKGLIAGGAAGAGVAALAAFNASVARALRSTERDVLGEIEAYLGPVDVTADEHVHQEQFDFAFI